MQGKGDKPERLIEVRRRAVLRFNHDGENGQILRHIDNPLQRIGYQNLTDPLPSHLLMPGKPSDQRGGDMVIARKLGRQVARNFVQRQGECAQAIEANNLGGIVERDEHPRYVPAFILARALLKPIVKLRLATPELRAVVTLRKWFEDYRQAGSADGRLMALKCLDQTIRRRGRIRNRFQERIGIGL